MSGQRWRLRRPPHTRACGAWDVHDEDGNMLGYVFRTERGDWRAMVRRRDADDCWWVASYMSRREAAWEVWVQREWGR